VVDGRHASSVKDVKVVYCDSDHQLDQTDNGKISEYENVHGATQRKYNVRKLKDVEIMIYIKNRQERGLLSEETSATEWENIKKLLKSVASEVVGCEERKKRNDWYDECQRKVEERKKF
jgi:hypothetical protein